VRRAATFTASEDSRVTTIGMVVFPGFELLDLAGPMDVLARAADVRVVTVAKSNGVVEPDLAPAVRPDCDFAGAPPLEILFVPGGHGIGEALGDDATLDFIADRGRNAQFVTSVCTGALLLGASGLLRGFRATTHWRYLDLLALCDATPVAQRVVEDRNRITGGGVTAGIDFGLALVAKLRGAEAAKRLQLGLEYDPAPPFASGHPRVADKALVDEYVGATKARYDDRERIVRDAIARRSR
jgi:cyclohexyl-isocyanide hydratase